MFLRKSQFITVIVTIMITTVTVQSLAFNTNATAQNTPQLATPVSLPALPTAAELSTPNTTTTSSVQPIQPIQPASKPASIKTIKKFTTTSITTNAASNDAVKTKQNNAPKKWHDTSIKFGFANYDNVYNVIIGNICLYNNKICNAINEVYCDISPYKATADALISLGELNSDAIIMKAVWQQNIMNNTIPKLSKVLPKESLRFVTSLGNEDISIIVKRSSGITQLGDLINKSIAIDKDDIGAETMFNTVIKSQIEQANINGFNNISNMQIDEALSSMCRGTVDAVVLAVEHPNKKIQKISKMCDIAIVEISPEIIKNISANNTIYFESIIPGGIYVGVPYSIRTIGTKTIIASSSEVNTEIIYRIAKSIFSNIHALSEIHPSLKNINIDTMLNVGRMAPLHTGVIQYLQEIKYDMNKLAKTQDRIEKK